MREEDRLEKAPLSALDEQVEQRNALYTHVLEEYLCEEHLFNAQRRTLRAIFFHVITWSFIGIVMMAFACLAYLLVTRPDMRVEDIPLVVGCVTSIISSMIVLPKIIAVHLFPANGDASTRKIVSDMQLFDMAQQNQGELEIAIPSADEPVPSEYATVLHGPPPQS